jgi:hypothetical protein
VVIIAGVPVLLLIGFAVRVFTRDRRASRASHVAAYSAIVLAVIISAVVTWAAIVFARGYHY